MSLFDLSEKERQQSLSHAVSLVHDYYTNTTNRNVTPDLDLDHIRQYVKDGMTKADSLTNADKINHVFNGLESFAVQIAHPSYFGLFNPRPAFPGIVSDLLTATTNPQMAAWSHNPFCYAVEEFIIAEMGKRFGFDHPDGTFCSGGAEANQTAVLCALNHKFPMYLTQGLQALSSRPVLYCSAETHHSIAKAARMCGLGSKSVRLVPTNKQLQLKTDDLSRMIDTDLQDNMTPFMIVATAGTTGPGSIDDLNSLFQLSEKYETWFHVDAAFAGALCLTQKHKQILTGIEHADSITVDIHKWLSAPMGTGCFITRHQSILESTFRITAEYMPKDGNSQEATDPYVRSIQWSRRSLGLRFYMSLLFFGWDGFEQTLNHHMAMGELLKNKLIEKGWQIQNHTALPIICFSKEEYSDNNIADISAYIVNNKKAWISTYPIHGKQTLRACITNYATSEQELNDLVNQLQTAEEELSLI